MPKQNEPPPLLAEPKEPLGVAPAVLAKRELGKSNPWCPKPESVNIEYDSMCDPNNPKTITYKDVYKATMAIKEDIPKTLLLRSRYCKELNVELHFKLETFHPTGSFCERGALFCLMALNEDQRKSGVISASLGNWAMALSYHGCRLRIPVTVVLPTITLDRIVDKCQNHGAKVVLYGRNFSEAKRKAFVLLAESGATYINSYDHPHSIAAAGSIGIEIMEQLPQTDAILVPVGGGGLLAGVTTAAKKLKPDVLIYGFESHKSCCFFKAMTNENPYDTIVENSLANSLAVPTAGWNAFHTAKSYIDKLVLIDDDCIARAILHMVENEMLVAEGAGVVGMSALMALPKLLPELRGKTVVCVISGGNIDIATLPRCIERAKALDGRIIKVTLTLPMSKVTERFRILKIIGNVGCHIRYCYTERDWKEDSNFFNNIITLICETRDLAHACTLKRVLNKLFPDICDFLEEPFSPVPVCFCMPSMK